MNVETPTTDSSLEILSESDIGYQFASTGQRFINYLIDNILMQFGLSLLTGFVVGLVLREIAPDLLVRMVTEGTTEYYFFVYIVGSVNYILYYTLCEKLFNGRTLGKLITGTKAVRLDGSPLTFRNALLRSLSRIVPFEVLSGFGTPWVNYAYFRKRNQFSELGTQRRKEKTGRNEENNFRCSAQNVASLHTYSITSFILYFYADYQLQRERHQSCNE